jgi:hypothetical protein
VPSCAPLPSSQLPVPSVLWQPGPVPVSACPRSLSGTSARRSRPPVHRPRLADRDVSPSLVQALPPPIEEGKVAGLPYPLAIPTRSDVQCSWASGARPWASSLSRARRWQTGASPAHTGGRSRRSPTSARPAADHPAAGTRSPVRSRPASGRAAGSRSSCSGTSAVRCLPDLQLRPDQLNRIGSCDRPQHVPRRVSLRIVRLVPVGRYQQRNRHSLRSFSADHDTLEVSVSRSLSNPARVSSLSESWPWPTVEPPAPPGIRNDRQLAFSLRTQRRQAKDLLTNKFLRLTAIYGFLKRNFPR